MKTIETTIVVDESHQATVQLPADVAPGPPRVVMMIEGPTTARAPLTFAAHDVGLCPRDLTSDVRRSMATTADDPVFVDTNVLVHANKVASPLQIGIP
jgi:hypothetical protein